MIIRTEYLVLLIVGISSIGFVLSLPLFSGGHSSLSYVIGDPHEGHNASAGSLPLRIEDHFRPKVLSGDAEAKDAKGNPKFLQILHNDVVDPDRHCEFCSLFRYTPGSQGVAGIAYGINDGAQPLDLSNAKRVHLFVMGEVGGEKIKLNVAGKYATLTDEEKINKKDTYALSTQQITLTNDWTPIEIDLAKVSKEKLMGVSEPFAIEISKGNGLQKQGVFVKYIVFDTETAKNPVPSATG